MELNFKNWFEENQDKKQKVRNLLDGQNMIMFFTKDQSIFGCPEESRLVFARMMSPDEDWDDDANFSAFDLLKTLAGDQVENLFSKKDLTKIKVIDKDKAEDMLINVPISKNTLKIKSHA